MTLQRRYGSPYMGKRKAVGVLLCSSLFLVCPTKEE